MNVFIASAAVLIATATAAAQVSVTRPGASTGKAAEALTEVVAMRELRDGRLMVIDNVRAERTIWIVNFGDGSLTQFGRRGQGPGEYQEPTSLLPLGDSLLIVDPLAQRVLVVSATGDIMRTGSFLRRVGDPALRWLRSPPDGIDTRGQLYYSYEVFNPDRTGPTLLPAGGIARANLDRSAEVSITDWASRGAEQPLVANSNVAVWPLRDGWAVRHDGLLAKVLANRYEVVWFRDGREAGRTGALPAPETRVTAADRDAQIEEWDKVPVMQLGGGGAAGGGSRRNPIAQYLREHPDAFPDRQSPLARVSPNVMFDPMGRLWIVRAKSARVSRYTADVVQEGRGVVGRVELPPGHQLIGFGRSSLYTVRVDDDGLQWIERFGIPAI